MNTHIRQTNCIVIIALSICSFMSVCLAEEFDVYLLGGQSNMVGRGLVADVTAATSDATTTLWYETPGTEFTQGMPLGNGRLGMTILGDPVGERIVLNEESMWNGSPFEDNRPDAHKVLPEIRELLLKGENKKAHDLVNQTFTCAGVGSGSGRRPDGKHYGYGRNVPFGCYQTLGDLRLEHGGKGAISGYRRGLDLSTGVASVSFEQDGATFSREYFVSEPDQAGIIRCRADQAGRISFQIHMDRPERFKTSVVNGDLLMTGTLNDGAGADGTRQHGEGTSYVSRIRVRNKGGQVEAVKYSAFRIEDKRGGRIRTGSGYSHKH